MSFSSACRALSFVGLVGALSGGVLAGAGASADVAGMKTIDLPLLLDLPGDLAPVRYTPGALDRSAAVQARFELLAKEFGKSGFRATAMVVYVLSPEDWKTAGLATPYGFPHPLALDAVAVPAWAEEKVVATYRGFLGGELPLPRGTPILATQAEAGALVVVDLLTQLEVSRQLAQRAGLGGDQPWIAPLVWHLVARLAWDKFEPGKMPEIAAILDRLAANRPAGPGLPLSAWRQDLPVVDRWWFDARFLRGADQMALEKSSGSLWRMLSRAIEKKEPLTEALLVKEFPGLAAWKTASFAAEE